MFISLRRSRKLEEKDAPPDATSATRSAVDEGWVTQVEPTNGASRPQEEAETALPVPASTTSFEMPDLQAPQQLPRSGHEEVKTDWHVPMSRTSFAMPDLRAPQQLPTSGHEEVKTDWQVPISRTSFSMPDLQVPQRLPTSRPSFAMPNLQTSQYLPTSRHEEVKTDWQVPTSKPSFAIHDLQAPQHLPTGRPSFAMPNLQTSLHLPTSGHEEVKTDWRVPTSKPSFAIHGLQAPHSLPASRPSFAMPNLQTSQHLPTSRHEEVKTEWSAPTSRPSAVMHDLQAPQTIPMRSSRSWQVPTSTTSPAIHTIQAPQTPATTWPSRSWPIPASTTSFTVQESKPAWTVPSSTTSFAIEENKIDYPAPKRSRLLGGEVDDKVALVRSALGSAPGFSTQCLRLVRALVPGSLGPPRADRDQFQEAAARMVGRVLREIEAAADAHYRTADVKYSQTVGERGLLEATVEEKSRLVQSAMAAVAEGSERLAEGRRRLEQAKAALRTRTELTQAEKKLAAVSLEKQRIEDVYKRHFLPLKNGTCYGVRDGSSSLFDQIDTDGDGVLSRQELEQAAASGMLTTQESWPCSNCGAINPSNSLFCVKCGVRRSDGMSVTPSVATVVHGASQHIEVLEKFLHALNVEDCLLASWRKAAVHPPSQRGRWCESAMLNVEKYFEEPLREIDARWTEAKIARDAAESDGQSYETSVRIAEGEYQRMIEDLRSLQENEKGAIAALSAAKQALNVDAGTRQLEQDREACRLTLGRLQGGALAAYQWLLEHSTRGFVNYTPSADCESELASCLRKCLTQSEACREMMVSAVVDSLGPSPSDRDSIQGEVAAMIGDVLRGQEGNLAAGIAKSVSFLGGTREETSKLTDGRNSEPIATAEAIVAEKQANLAAIDGRAMEKQRGVESLRAELRNAEMQLRKEEELKAQVERAYTNNFLPLKEGRCRDEAAATSHIELLVELFERWGSDPQLKQAPSKCLLPGFRVAAKRQPGQRGQFDHQVMEEVESLFADPVRELQTHVMEWQGVVARLRAQVDVGSDQGGDRRVATEELRVSQEILKKTKELTHFRMHCLEKYRMLLETGIAQQSRYLYSLK